jgi:hypothetical protein
MKGQIFSVGGNNFSAGFCVAGRSVRLLIRELLCSEFDLIINFFNF